MPIYEYRCSSCGKEVEALQKLSEPPLVECPACHQQRLETLTKCPHCAADTSGGAAAPPPAPPKA